MSAPTPRLDPQKLSPTDAALLLSRVGGRRVQDTTIETDVAADAPRNEDGALSLVASSALPPRGLELAHPGNHWLEGLFGCAVAACI